jgi:hypothetical protein
MGKFHDSGFDIFDQDGDGQPTDDVRFVLERMIALMESGKCTMADGLEGLLNMLRPGSTKTSHDILQQFLVGMHVQGFGELGHQVHAIWLTTFPWGIGFHIGFNPEYPPEAMSDKGKQAIIQTLCGILQAGHINAAMTEEGRIRITEEDGTEHDVQVDHLVDQFRTEIDEKLGPDGPIDDGVSPEQAEQITEWMKRWTS